MNKNFRFHFWSVLLVLLISFLVTGQLPAAAEKVVEKTFKVNAGGSLIINSDLGSIKVTAAGDDQVQAKVFLKADVMGKKEGEKILADFDLSFDQSGDNVTITGENLRKRTGLFGLKSNRLRVRFEVSVPKKYNVDLNTAGGSISVADLDGTVKSTTSGGSLDFGNINGPVTGNTSGGSIQLQSCIGDAVIKTSGGSITIGSVVGNVDARTSGGSVSITKAKGRVIAKSSGGSITVDEVAGEVDAGTSGGSVTAHITDQPSSRCSLTTSGGGITVYLAEGIRLSVDAQTSGGVVKTDFKVTVQGRLEKSALKGEINGGGPELYLRTSGGNIYIEKR